MRATGAGRKPKVPRTGAIRALVEEVHDELAEQGHPGLRPSQGFALQAVGDGATAGVLGQRREMLQLSAVAFDRVAARWRTELGEPSYEAMVRGLLALGSADGTTDFGSWLGSPSE